jgi:predicted phosphodiesterase
MSRIALITDIHGNLPGLQAVWRDIEACACDRVICLGDLVDGGDDNDEVVRFLRDAAVPCILGNHDENTALDLAADVRDFLASLPMSITEGDIYYTHISPRASQKKIVDPYEAWNVFDEHSARLTFVGHAHIPLLFGERGAHAATSTDYPIVHNQPFALDPTDRYIVAVDAVGYPRDGIRHPRYAIFDDIAGTVEMRLVDGPVLPYG